MPFSTLIFYFSQNTKRVLFTTTYAATTQWYLHNTRCRSNIRQFHRVKNSSLLVLNILRQSVGPNRVITTHAKLSGVL